MSIERKSLATKRKKKDAKVNPRLSIPVPKVQFESFYKKFDSVKDLMKSQEWKAIYSNYYHFDKIEQDIKFELVDELETYSEEKQLEEIEKCVKSFSYFCHKYVKIMHPLHGRIPFILYIYQQRAAKEFEEKRFNIISKFRQGGLTTISVIWGIWRCLFKTDQKIMVVSKTDREAVAAGSIVDTVLENLPSWIYASNKARRDPDKAKHEKVFRETDSVLYFYTVEAARGKSLTVLIVDEAAFIKNMEEHWAAIYPVISTGGSCIIVSTVNGLGNWYADIYHQAKDRKNGFNVIELDYWEHPYYNDPAWIDDNRRNLGEKRWAQEIERDFLNSGETYISGEIIERLEFENYENRPRRCTYPDWVNSEDGHKYEWNDEGAFWIWEEPIDGHEYILSADCAEGVGETGDNNCFQLLDVNSLKQVGEFYSNTIQPHVFAQVIHRVGIYYNNALVIVDAIGTGIAVLSNLQHDLFYENLFHETRRTTSKPGMTINKTNRPVILESLQHRIENNSVKINSIRLVRELKTFKFNPKTKKAEAGKGCHDDAVMALAVALFFRDMQNRDLPVGAELPEEAIKIFKSETFEEIRRQLMEDAPENWLEIDKKPELDIFNDNAHIPTEYELNFVIQRKHDKILKQFGW